MKTVTLLLGFDHGIGLATGEVFIVLVLVNGAS
jgi:hypothetical protein